MVHKRTLLSPKTEWNTVICSNMDEPRDYRNKWSKPDRGINIIWYCLYVEYRKQMIQINLYVKMK